MNKTNYQIRILQRSDDLNDLILLSKKFFEEYEGNDDYFKIDELSDEDITDYFDNFIDSENKKAFIAIENNQIIGYITAYIKDQPSFWKIKTIGDISGLMVDKDYRRMGIATQLLSNCKDFFKEKNVMYYTLFTSVNNVDGLEFYIKNGMEPLYTTLKGKAI